jgi:hypothetical protein
MVMLPLLLLLIIMAIFATAIIVSLKLQKHASTITS